jgi:hypothetical protein
MVYNAASICSRESEDTMLMILKEVYSTMGITADNHVLQQHIPADRSTSSILSYSATSVDADVSRVSDSVAENKETGLGSCQSECSFMMSSQVASSPVTTYSVDLNSSALSLAAPTGTVTSTFVASNASSGHPLVGMDPTAPLTENKNLGPPPVMGFVRK